MRISRCQQSMKGILWKIDCQLAANEGEGGRVTRLLQSLIEHDYVLNKVNM